MKKDLQEHLFKLIGLDRFCLTATTKELVPYNEDCIPELNENAKGINIECSRLNQGLYEISVTAPMMFYNSNEKNVTLDKLPLMIKILQKRLEEYGISLDVANVKLGSFEINTNFDDVKLYALLKLIAKANVNDHFKAFIVENINGIQSVKIKKSEYMAKAYKKSEHLQELFQSTEAEHLVRFEISTNRDREKAKMLGDNITLQGLIDNWDNVLVWYCNCIKNTIKKPVAKYCSDIEKQVISMLEAGLKPRQIIDKLMFKEDLIDLYPIENAFTKHYKKAKRGSVSRDINRIHDRLKSIDEERYQQVTNNIEKLQEIYAILGI